MAGCFSVGLNVCAQLAGELPFEKVATARCIAYGCKVLASRIVLEEINTICLSQTDTFRDQIKLKQRPNWPL